MTDTGKNMSIAFFCAMRGQSLFDRLGSEAAWQHVKNCFDLIREETEQHGGTMIKTITMRKALCAFPSSAQAICAAVAIQERNSVVDAPMIPIAVGISQGIVLCEEGDVFGHTVHVAARILEETKGNQILTSKEAIQPLPPNFEPAARRIDQMPAKGIEEPIDVFEVVWEPEDITRLGSSSPTRRRVRLRLNYGSKEIVLDETSGDVTLGRGKDVDLHVGESLASRVHLRLERRRGKFVATDQSANGTYVEMNDQSIHIGRKESLILVGSGRLALGSSLDKAREIITFECLED